MCVWASQIARMGRSLCVLAFVFVILSVARSFLSLLGTVPCASALWLGAVAHCATVAPLQRCHMTRPLFLQGNTTLCPGPDAWNLAVCMAHASRSPRTRDACHQRVNERVNKTNCQMSCADWTAMSRLYKYLNGRRLIGWFSLGSVRCGKYFSSATQRWTHLTNPPQLSDSNSPRMAEHGPGRTRNTGHIMEYGANR